MHYETTQINRATGNLITITENDWVTIPELARPYHVRSAKARAVLADMLVLEPEGDEHRLTTWAVEDGVGKRIADPRSRSGTREVISPRGQKLIAFGWQRSLERVEMIKRAQPIIKRVAFNLETFRSRSVNRRSAQEEVTFVLECLAMLSADEADTVRNATQPC